MEFWRDVLKPEIPIDEPLNRAYGGMYGVSF